MKYKLHANGFIEPIEETNNEAQISNTALHELVRIKIRENKQKKPLDAITELFSKKK